MHVHDCHDLDLVTARTCMRCDREFPVRNNCGETLSISMINIHNTMIKFKLVGGSRD